VIDGIAFNDLSEPVWVFNNYTKKDILAGIQLSKHLIGKS
jgi:hypothetical protein